MGLHHFMFTYAILCDKFYIPICRCMDEATATTIHLSAPSTSNEREGTASATASTATPSISDEREITIGCLVPTHSELSRNCDVLFAMT